MGGRDKALRNLVYVVAVAHPGHALDGQPLEQLAGDIVISAGLPVLPGRVLLGGDHPSPQGLCHKLASVADPQNGHTPNAVIAGLREKIGTGNVLLALSGGVDSSVAAALLAEAVGPQLTCVFVDHGLMRQK